MQLTIIIKASAVKYLNFMDLANAWQPQKLITLKIPYLMVTYQIIMISKLLCWRSGYYFMVGMIHIS